MHRFDWRARQRHWLGHACLRSGHCWGPAVSSGRRRSALLCPSIAECCVKVEGGDSSLPGKLLIVNKLQNTFSLPLSDSSVHPFFSDGLLSCTYFSSLSAHTLRQWQARLNFTVRVPQSEKAARKTHSFRTASKFMVILLIIDRK